MGAHDPLADYTPDWRERRLPIGGQVAPLEEEEEDPLADYRPDWRRPEPEQPGLLERATGALREAAAR